MNEYQIVLTGHAVADLKNFSEKDREKIHSDIHLLKKTPFSSGKRIKRLKGFKPPLFRLRSGDHRIIYQIEQNSVIILRAIDRKLLDRILKRLKI
jgi:mRNA-degrading endonuclease RelE of RelBE toxin-antitoxin system